MNFQQFYSPEDGPGAPGNGAAGDSTGKVILPLNVKGEITNYDATDPDQAKVVIDLAQKGLSAEQKWDEMSEIRTAYNKWNDLMAAARDDEDAFNTVKELIEKHTGAVLSKNEAQDVLDDAFADPSARSAVEKLERKLSTVEKTFRQELEDREMAAQISAEAARLEQKYKDFNREEVFKEAKRLGTTDLETAYRSLNYEKHIEAAKKAGQSKQENLDNKRDAAFSESGTAPVEPPAKPERKGGRRSSAVANEILKEQKEKGISFFTND